MRALRILTAAALGLGVVLVASPALAEKKSFTATLSGAEEAPGPGDPDGSGTARIDIDESSKQLCYQLSWSNIDDPTAGHIHEAPKGRAGTVEVNLDLPKNGPKACITGELAHVLAQPEEHYVNLHNAAFPDGAIRGQLVPAQATSLPRTGVEPFALVALALGLVGLGRLAMAAPRR
jgi:CHRD domain.